MSFMQPHIEFASFYLVETVHGTECIPEDVCGAITDPRQLQGYCEGDICFDEDIPASEQVPELRTGWIARLSAPGYMDCTDWSWHETEDEAREYLADAYGTDDENEEE